MGRILVGFHHNDNCRVSQLLHLVVVVVVVIVVVVVVAVFVCMLLLLLLIVDKLKVSHDYN